MLFRWGVVSWVACDTWRVSVGKCNSGVMGFESHNTGIRPATLLILKVDAHVLWELIAAGRVVPDPNRNKSSVP